MMVFSIEKQEILDEVADIDLVVNLKLREDMLMKHMDRCCCTECGSNFCDAKENQDCCSTCKALTLVPGATNMMEYMGLLRDRLKTHSIQVCDVVQLNLRGTVLIELCLPVLSMFLGLGI